MLAVFLWIGLLGGAHEAEPAAREDNAEAGSFTWQEARFLTPDEPRPLDDFLIAGEAHAVSHAEPVSAGGAAALLFAVVPVWFCGFLLSKRRHCFDKEKIPVFRVIVFIHRTDGKKRPCFESVK